MLETLEIRNEIHKGTLRNEGVIEPYKMIKLTTLLTVTLLFSSITVFPTESLPPSNYFPSKPMLYHLFTTGPYYDPYPCHAYFIQYRPAQKTSASLRELKKAMVSC